MKKSAFIAGFTGVLLTGFIAKMPATNAEDIPLCLEGQDVAISSGDVTYLTGNCTLNKDFTGNLVVGSNITATLNLNDKNLSSSSGVTLKNLGNLTITGEGNVLSTNNYTIQNQNTLKIEGGSYKIDPSSSSNASVIENGWNLTSTAGAVPAEKPAGSANYATLEITGGHFTGKINNVKNDENGIMKISGGLFDSTLAITNSNAASVLHGGKSLEVTGGELQRRIFVQSMGADKQKTLSVSGGTVYNIAFDTTKANIDPAVSHDVLLTGGNLSATLPSGITYGTVEVHDFSGGSFTYAGSGDTKINAYNLNLTGSFNVNNGDITEVTLKNSTVSQFSCINKGELNVYDVDATSGGYIKAANGVLNIYSGHIGKQGKMITTTKNNHGTINIYDGYVYGTLTPTNETINVFGGRFLKISDEQTDILTTAVANGNAIAGTNKELIEYQDGEDTWYFIGNRESSSTIINDHNLGEISLSTPIETIGTAKLAIVPVSEEDLANLQEHIKNLKTVYDIAIIDETGEIVPVENNQLRIRLNLPEKYRGYDHYTVVYLDSDGEIIEQFAATVTNNILEYTTPHLSLYGIIAYNDESTPETEPKPDEKPSKDTVVDDTTEDDVPVPHTSSDSIKPSVPNTGYDEERSKTSNILWILGFVSVTIAGILAIIKKTLKA